MARHTHEHAHPAMHDDHSRMMQSHTHAHTHTDARITWEQRAPHAGLSDAEETAHMLAQRPELPPCWGCGFSGHVKRGRTKIARVKAAPGSGVPVCGRCGRIIDLVLA